MTNYFLHLSKQLHDTLANAKTLTDRHPTHWTIIRQLTHAIDLADIMIVDFEKLDD